MNKIIIYIFMILGLLSTSFATLNDSLIYYTFDEDDVVTDSVQDISGNNNHGDCVNMGGDCNTIISQVLNNASDFVDVSSNYIEMSGDFTGNILSYSIWVYLDAVEDEDMIFQRRDATGGPTTNYQTSIESTGGFHIEVALYDTSVSSWSVLNGNTSIASGNLYHIVHILNGTHQKLYVDGVFNGELAYNTAYQDVTDKNYMGRDSSLTTRYMDGEIDEFGFWERALTVDEVHELYNSGAGFNPYTIVPTATSPTIESNLTTVYPVQTITTYLNSSSLTNMSYYLDGGVETSICDNCDEYNLTLSTLSLGDHTIIFSSNNGSTEVNSTYNFSVVSLTITNNIPAELNEWDLENAFTCGGYAEECIIEMHNTNYSLTTVSQDITNSSDYTNVGNAFDNNSSTYAQGDVADNQEGYIGKEFEHKTYLKTINYKLQPSSDDGSSINYQPKLQIKQDGVWNTIETFQPCTVACYLNTFENTTIVNDFVEGVRILDTGGITDSWARVFYINYTKALSPEYNGNVSYTIYSINGTAQTTESGVLYFNPYQYFTFNDANNDSISSFSIDGVSQTNPFTFKIYDYGLGQQTISFSSLGFIDTLVNFSLTNQSRLNSIYLVPLSQINVFVYDRNTGNLINESVDITLIASVGDFGTTTNGTYTFSRVGFLNESYEILATSTNYISESIYFNFNNKEISNQSIYLVPSNQTNLGTLTLIIKNVDGSVIDSAICKVLEWDSTVSAFYTVAQGSSNINGECILNIELEDKVYQFEVSKTDYQTELTPRERIYIDGDTRTVILKKSTTIIETFGDNFIIIPTETTINENQTRINFYSTNLDGESYTACIETYKKTAGQKTTLTEDCVTSNTVDFSKTFYTNNSYWLYVDLSITHNGLDIPVAKYEYEPSNGLGSLLNNLNILSLIGMLMLLVGVGIIVTKSPEVGLAITLVSIYLLSSSFPMLISGTFTAFATVIIIIIYYTIFRRTN